MTTRRGVVRLVSTLLAAVVATGCGSSAPAAGSAAASPSPAVVRPSGSGIDVPPSPVATGGATTAPSGPGLVVDASLLRVLPTRIDGVALEPDSATAAQIATDPTLAESASAIAVALAIRSGTSSGDDLAIASVIRLRPGVFTDAWYVTWRTTYDASACAVAGGVKGAPSPVSIAGRMVFVGTCAGDAQTYHVHLADPTLIVSVTATGAAHFGELVMAGLSE